MFDPPLAHSRKAILMAAKPSAKLLLIVVGSTLRAEEVDRPLGYFLKQRVEQYLADHERELGSGSIRVRVIADFRWIHDELLHGLPTISVGGPGVNELAHRWLEEVPVSLAVEQRAIICKWTPISTSPAPASGGWTTRPRKLPFPCLSIDSCHVSSTTAPPSPRTQTRTD